MCVLTASVVASAGVGGAWEVVDSGICLYPRSFETRSFKAEVFNSLVGACSVPTCAIEGVSPIDIGIVVKVSQGLIKVGSMDYEQFLGYRFKNRVTNL